MTLFARPTSTVKPYAAADEIGEADLRPNARTLALLATHMDIGWDFDGTLVGHPAAPLFHDFIRKYRAIRHVIVTFRTHSSERLVWSELARYKTAPDRACFEGVLNIPAEAVDELVAARERLGFVRRLLSNSAAEQRCRQWKGEVCRAHGLTALVDDMTALVASGCRRNDIALFHPDHFLIR